MKDYLNYYYDINILEVENWHNSYRFNYNGSIYYFVPVKRGTEEINEILKVSQELKLKNIKVHDIIFNKFNKVISNVASINYCLLKPDADYLVEYDLNSMLNFNKMLGLNPLKSNLYRNSWASLWSAKIDYFEYQIRELGQGKNVILNSISYYIGLAENAISYVNNASSKYSISNSDAICLSHKRITFPNYGLNYLNPLSFIFDIEVRDIAEYLKSAFFAGENALNYLKFVLKKKNFAIYSLAMLYARLLYPTYYFDIYESIINNEESEEALFKVLDKSLLYEEFLRQAYLEISKYAPIERINWLFKKEL